MNWHERDSGERPGWFGRLHLSWPMLFLAGWVLYELTTQPTLGAVAVCLKFGWEDFRAAIWLRRVDPQRLRGRACFWLYLASGLTKTAGVAGVMSFAFVAASPKGPAAQAPRAAAIIEMFAWTGFTMLMGLGCATLTLGYAVALARWDGFKLWLSRDIHRARRRNEWPPYGQRILQNNRLELMLIGALFVVVFPLSLLIIIVAILFGQQFNDRFAAIVGLGGILFLTFVYPVLLLVFRDRTRMWLAASHPGECWDDSTTLSSDGESLAEMFDDPVK